MVTNDGEQIVPYQFTVPVLIKDRALRKGIPLAPYMRMAMEKFATQPASVSQKEIEDHERTMKRRK